jgi:pimeloyl-ACP methyl ester carboxylesterase
MPFGVILNVGSSFRVGALVRESHVAQACLACANFGGADVSATNGPHKRDACATENILCVSRWNEIHFWATCAPLRVALSLRNENHNPNVVKFVALGGEIELMQIADKSGPVALRRKPAAHVVLVHGMGRTPLSMLLLACRLRRAGLKPLSFGYSATFESFAGIAERLARRFDRLGQRPSIGIGHSLGGLLLRAAVARLAPTTLPPRHLFMLGTPNRSPSLARSLRHRRLYRLVHGDSGQMLGDPQRMNALPPLRVPTTEIAGTAGLKGRWTPFGDEANDGIVSVREAELDGATLIQLPLLHSFIMNSKRVAEIVLRCV